ncbi:hypothetical protein MTO96_001961 [Rhipicephalus appendiculatus]
MAEDLDSLKCIISALLVAHRGRMTISEFTRVYKSEEGHPVPFENFGCTNVRQFLNKISDTVTLTRGSTGEDVIQAKVKQELKHIDQMVKQQKPSSTKPKIKHAMHRPPVRGKKRVLLVTVNQTRRLCAAHSILVLWHTSRDLLGAQASTGRDELELARGAVRREFADNQTQVAPEVANKGTSTGDITVGIPKGFATCLRSILDEYPTGLDIEVLMEMCEERIGSSAYFKQNKHPLEMLPDILSSVSSACVMPDSGGMFRVMLPQKEKQNSVPALPDDLRCGLLSILLKAPDGLEASELLDMYESRFGEHRHIKAHGQRTSDFIRNILYALPFTAVKNCGDGGHIVKMLEEGFQHPMQNVGQSTPQITADELNAYPVQELPHCWTFSVAIGEVFSPSEFYVLITADGALTQLADLMAELDEFYNSASSDFYSVNIGDLKPGFVCAALYTNDGQPLWHRAVVKSVQAREVFVFYIDYGTVMPVKVADIRRLRSDFLEFPAQAIKASLSGVKPKNEQAWTPKAKERFLQLVRMGECSCSVVSKEEDVCFVELLMSDGSMEYSISEVLIYEEFAVSTIVTEAVAPGTSIETWTFSDGYTADIIVWNGQRYMSSMGVSKVFGWKDDLVSKKLSEKGIRVDGALLEKKCVPELHLEVLNELDINSGRKVVTEPSKLSASSSSKHPKNTAGSSKSVVDKFQSKLLEALMTSKQK